MIIHNKILFYCSPRSQAPPPRSLQELLERQWEQTAQFILDQAGKQNNGKLLHVVIFIAHEAIIAETLATSSFLRKFTIIICDRPRENHAYCAGYQSEIQAKIVACGDNYQFSLFGIDR